MAHHFFLELPPQVALAAEPQGDDGDAEGVPPEGGAREGAPELRLLEPDLPARRVPPGECWWCVRGVVRDVHRIQR